MFLLFDVSTNGKPKNWKAHFTDTFSWPRLLQISWLLYDKKGNLTEEGDYLIKPHGFDISEEILKIHQLDQVEIEEKGVDVKVALKAFSEVVEKTTYTFAFNLQYNENVVLAEFYRANMDHKFMQSERYCLMRESTYYCQIMGRDGRYKWPTLAQLHQKLFNVRFEGAGNARKDLEALSRCFNKLLSLRQLDDLF
ncbi:MAG: hypothetical protein OEQ53_00875 [Saprospiraceae bacterium]|nr:hypothetical protein [Saprospiraceae bacterium]